MDVKNRVVRRLAGLAAIMLCLAAPALTGAAPATPDLAIYARQPAIGDAQLSPSGAFVAMVIADGENRFVAIYDVGAKKVVKTMAAGRLRLHWVDWVDDDNLIVTSDETTRMNGMFAGAGIEVSSATIFNLKDKTAHPLLGARAAGNIVYSKPLIRRGRNGKTRILIKGMAVVAHGLNAGLYEVFLPSGDNKLVQAGDYTSGFLVDGEGEVAAEGALGYDMAEAALKLRKNGKKVDIALPKEAADPSLEGFSHDGQQVLVSYRLGDKRLLASAAADGALTSLGEFDGQDILMDRTNNRRFGVSSWSGDQLTYRFDEPADQRVWTGLTRAFAGRTVSFLDASSDRKRWLIKVESRTELPAIFLFDLTTGQAEDLGAVHKFKPEEIAPVRAVSYKASDGLTVTGYLTLPHSAGDDPKGLPLVVLPHEGPVRRDFPEFNWWAQALAAQGYAVLQPNYRGSRDLGMDFMVAGYGQWGRKMQTDLSDGVRDLAAKGVIDPRRVCIAGLGYGGYAAIAGVTLQQGVYRCAISVGGIVDLKQIMGDVRTASTREWRTWKRALGVTGPRDPGLDAISPLSHVDDVSAPILLVHAKDDADIDLDQSQAMEKALKKAGKPYEFVILENGGHDLTYGSGRLQMLKAVSTFLTKNNPS